MRSSPDGFLPSSPVPPHTIWFAHVVMHHAAVRGTDERSLALARFFGIVARAVGAALLIKTGGGLLMIVAELGRILLLARGKG